MKWWIKFGCFLTGWNSNILSQCSEASYKHLKKYTSALLILILLWGFTGFCFAQRYVHAPVWGCIVSSLIFIIVIIQIERQIILTVGSNKMGVVFRFFIAIIMAVLGSAILDQVIFGEDIKKKMVEITDRQVREQLPMRLSVIDSKLQELKITIDSLDKVNIRLNEEIAKTPTVPQTGRSTTYKKVLQEDGSYKTVPETTVMISHVPNPRIKQVEANDTLLKRYRNLQDEFTNRKMDVEDNLRKELSESVGFLEELNAMIEIVSTRTEALIFYLIIFSFLISLELFVVASKMGDKKCDYDMIVEHQLKMKETTLKELSRNIK